MDMDFVNLICLSFAREEINRVKVVAIPIFLEKLHVFYLLCICKLSQKNLKDWNFWSAVEVCRGIWYNLRRRNAWDL